MELISKYNKIYGPGENDQEVKQRTKEILALSPGSPSEKILKKLFSFIDLTTLNTDDNADTAMKFCKWYIYSSLI